MIIKGLIEEDFVNYKKPSMFIIFSKCSFKCDKEAGCTVCQNSTLANEPNINISVFNIVEKYINNPITQAIVFGGLEPFDSSENLSFLIEVLRDKTQDDIVIYTGYTEEELENGNTIEHRIYQHIKQYPNIIVKFGRFIPNQESHYDEVLGVKLASPNQYAKKVS